MGVRVAYGKRSKIQSAITAGVIPEDSLIITNDAEEAELFFYDVNGDMKRISERTQFETLTEAKAWVQQYDCSGRILSIHNGEDWAPYIVCADNSLSPIAGGDGTISDVRNIDGGTAEGI